MADHLAQRLQRVLRTVGALGSEVHECGPFTLLVDAGDPLIHFNYAVPREPAPEAAAGPEGHTAASEFALEPEDAK